MSELIIEDDPDPLSYSRNGYPINLETGDAYDGHDLSDDLHKREVEYLKKEAKEQEKRAVGCLSATADHILKAYKVDGDYEDKILYDVTGDIMLRRHRLERGEGDRMFRSSLYFFVDRSNEGYYCRSWWSESGSVNWCQEEKRNEPAADVAARLEAAFPLKQPEIKQRRFGQGVLAKLVRA